MYCYYFFWKKYTQFFSTYTTHNLSKDAQSYFDTIDKFAVWDKPDDGSKDTPMHHFETSHTQVIYDEFEARSTIHTLANLYLVSSIKFTNGLINFISDTYKEYTLAWFSSSKSWSMTTRLARKIIYYIGLPQVRVQNNI